MFYFSFYSSQILHDMYVHYISSKTTLKNIHVVSVCYADSFKNSTKGFSFALCPLSLPFFTLFIIFTFLLPLSLSLSPSNSFSSLFKPWMTKFGVYVKAVFHMILREKKEVYIYFCN